MSFELLRKAIADKFKAEWTATSLDKVVYGDNRRGLKVDESSPSWLRVSHNVLNTENAQLGADFQRSIGFINLQIFTAYGIGEKTSNDLIDAATSIFENQNFSGVQTFAATPINVGRTGETYQQNLRIEFKYDVFS